MRIENNKKDNHAYQTDFLLLLKWYFQIIKDFWRFVWPTPNIDPFFLDLCTYLFLKNVNGKMNELSEYQKIHKLYR